MANYIKGTAIQENSISETKLDNSLQSWKETVTNHINNNDNPHNITKSSIGLDNVTNDAQVKRSELGVANGVATLDSTGKVPSGQLPSYVDDVIEGYLYNGVFYKDTSYTTSIVGESGKIYIDLPTNKTYRWTGSVYGVISETIALGETSSTAYRGDRGKIAYDHSQSAHAPSNAQANVIETIKVNGTALTPNSKAVDITVPTVGNGTITIKQGGTSKGTFTTNQNGNTTIELTDNNTTYTAGDGLSLSGTTFSNNGVRSIATGTTNGTISVNTNGNISNIGVYGLKSAAYTNSDAYAAASHTHSYLPLSGGTLMGSIEMGNNSITSANKEVLISYSGVDTYLKGRSHIYLDTPNLYQLADDITYTILHSGNYNSYALPLTGGTLTGSVMMSGIDTNLIRNITYTNTGGWARDLITLQVDGVNKFGVGAHGYYTAGASNNGVDFGYIGCNPYDGLNLRISETTLSWGDNTILHAGNFNSYAPKLDGTGASGTWGINISGNAGSANALNLEAIGDLNSVTDNRAFYSYFQALNRPSSNYATGILLKNPSLGCKYQLVFDADGGLFTRHYYSSWQPWKTIAFTDSDITGNAATATNADTLDGFHETGFYRALKGEIPGGDLALLEAGSYYNSSTVGEINPLPSKYTSLSVLGKSYFASQLCVNHNGSRAWLRGITNGTSITAYDWHELAFTDSNVASATKLQNSRTIWGQSFDGTGNVSGALTGVTDITASGHAKVYSLKTDHICIECDNSGNSSGRGSEINNYDGHLYLQHDTSNNCFICAGGGNVLIGTTTNSGKKLQVAGSILSDSGNNGGVLIGHKGNTIDGYYNGTLSDLHLNYTSSENLSMCMGGGNVGIGTISPSYKLDVAGSTRVETLELNYSTPYIDFHYGNSADDYTSRIIEGLSGQLTVTGKLRVGLNYTTSTDYAFHVNGDGYFVDNVITESDFSSRGNAIIDGYVGIGTQNPAYKLDVNGTIQCTKLLQTSDIKYKTNIKQIEYEEALKIIENLNPVTWDWNENTKISGSSSGFVAQEAEEFIPNAISRDNENNLSLDYTQLHSYEIKVIQEQQKEIKDLKQRLEVLENLVLQLTNREI